MYEYIKGKLVSLTPTEVIVETYGIGYKLLISLQTYSEIEKSKLEDITIYVHHVVKEDDELFYGFFTKDERAIFSLLISVSGVGPNTARIMLSSLTSEEVKEAIISEDVRRIQSIKGIGAKTAQRVILELKDKVIKGGGNVETNIISTSSNNEAKSEAMTALLVLGFGKPAIEKVLNKLLKEKNDYSVEELIKNALKYL